MNNLEIRVSGWSKKKGGRKGVDKSSDEQWLVLEDFDFCFAENGLTAYRLGQQMASQVSMDWKRKG